MPDRETKLLPLPGIGDVNRRGFGVNVADDEGGDVFEPGGEAPSMDNARPAGGMDRRFLKRLGEVLALMQDKIDKLEEKVRNLEQAPGKGEAQKAADKVIEDLDKILRWR